MASSWGVQRVADLPGNRCGDGPGGLSNTELKGAAAEAGIDYKGLSVVGSGTSAQATMVKGGAAAGMISDPLSRRWWNSETSGLSGSPNSATSDADSASTQTPVLPGSAAFIRRLTGFGWRRRVTFTQMVRGRTPCVVDQQTLRRSFGVSLVFKASRHSGSTACSAIGALVDCRGHRYSFTPD